MFDALDFSISFALACAGSLLLTPLVARLAISLTAVDVPDGRRKSHKLPVPLGGGVAVAVVVVLAMAATWLFLADQSSERPTWLVRGLLPSAIILLMVGIVDDVWGLTGIYKLIGQVLAASVMVAAGTKFDSISLFGMAFPLGSFGIPFTMFFCLGAINAFNLIDGADALASSIGAIVCLTLGLITAEQGRDFAALMCFALAGGLIGFLRYNLPPAKIYLGDTGSMLIGLVVAAVAIESSVKQQAAFVLAVPLAICAIPILDAAAALVRRVTTGQSVFAADRGHLHHTLMLRGWSARQMVGFVAGLTMISCGAALASFYWNRDWIAFLITGGMFVILAATRLFGHSEVALIAARSRSLVRSAIPRRVRHDKSDTESAVQLQGRCKWQTVWTALREAAPTYKLAGLTLQLNIPHLHESFYATWKCYEDAVPEDTWRMALPLTLDSQLIGKLSLIGTSSGQRALVDIQQLTDFLESLESEIRAILAGNAADAANGVATSREVASPYLLSIGE